MKTITAASALLTSLLLGAAAARADDARPAFVPHTAPFKHPGISHSRAELDFVRAKVAAGEGHWKTSWDRLKASRVGALDWKPQPRANVFRGPYSKPDLGALEFRTDASAAYTHALAWYISQEPAHADKAIEILNAYSHELKAIEGHDARLLIGTTGIMLLDAAEILRHTSDRWATADQEAFEKLIRELLFPLIKDFTPGHNGNWDAAQIQTMLAMGIFLDDHEIFNRALNHCLNGETNGAIRKYFNDFGECQESGRDQGHTQMGLGFLGCACEIAWKQGVDLYATADNRLALGYEYTAKYNLGNEVPFAPYRSIDGRYFHEKISDDRRGVFAPIYERVYRHYHDRRGLEMPFTRQVLEKIRPEGVSPRHTFEPWGTLMFCGQEEVESRAGRGNSE